MNLQWNVVASAAITSLLIIVDEFRLRNVSLPFPFPTVNPDTPFHNAIFLFGWACALSGGTIRYYCYRALGRLFTYQITIREDHKLITFGPYGIVRHPSYAGAVIGVPGSILFLFGPGNWFWSTGILWTFPGLIYSLTWILFQSWALYGLLLRIPVEDALLKSQFGVKWEEWASRVQYKVIPGVY